MKYIILMGLPASEKTTWAKKYQKENEKYSNGWNRTKEYGIYIIELDNYINNYDLTLEQAINKGLENEPYYNSTKEIIIDGLLLTNDSIIDAINCLNIYNNDKIEIHYWRENREQCLINDEYRREDNSSISIKNMTFEKVNLEYIKSKNINIDIDVIYHEVAIKEEWQIFSDKYDLYLREDSYIRSNKWRNGGTWCNCWGDSGNCSAESPSNFNEFDELLTKVCPNLSYMQYKNLWNNCVEIESFSEHDYYGGSEHFSFYKCDIKRLYDKLIEMDLISL